MAILYKTDGTSEELQVFERSDKTSLQIMQEAVGGWIELIYFQGPRQVLVVNEEGLIVGLDRNQQATELVRQYKPDLLMAGYIRGNAVLCSYEEAGVNYSYTEEDDSDANTNDG